MANELQKVNAHPIVLPTDKPKGVVLLQGEKPVYAKHIDNMNVTIHMSSTEPQLLKPELSPSLFDFDREFYNLFVVGDDFDIKTDQPFKVECKRALKEYMTNELKLIFSMLDGDDIIERIKRFPCLFAHENNYSGSTDEEQYLGFGYIREIKVRREGIKIYPHIMNLLKQQRINEMMFDLDIWGSSSYNELNRMHWSIKKVDLIAELRESGYQI